MTCSFNFFCQICPCFTIFDGISVSSCWFLLYRNTTDACWPVSHNFVILTWSFSSFLVIFPRIFYTVHVSCTWRVLLFLFQSVYLFFLLFKNIAFFWPEYLESVSCSIVSYCLQPHGLSGSSVHGILQAKILERVAISFSRIFRTMLNGTGDNKHLCVSSALRRKHSVFHH